MSEHPHCAGPVGNGVGPILGQKVRDLPRVPEERGGVDVAARDFRMLGENCSRTLERAVPYGCVDELRSKILGWSLTFRHSEMTIA